MHNRNELMDAMRRKRPARIPYTYEALPETEARLRAYLGVGPEVRLADHFGCNRFDSLWTALGAAPRLPERMARSETGDPRARVNVWGVRSAAKNTGMATYMEITHSPLAGAATVADVERHDWPRPEEVVFPEIPAGFDLQAWKRDRVISEAGYIGPFGIPWSVRGMEALMMDLVVNPAVVEAIVAKVEAFTLGCLEIIFRKYPGAIDVVSCGDDYGTQNGLFLSSAMIERFFMPSLKRHYDLARKHGAMAYHHCCGAIFAMIPLFLDAGLEVLNPIQTSAAGMDPAALKRAYGGRLAFHGGVDIQQTLVHGTPDDVRAEVRHRIDTLGPEGYILAPTHVLQPDAPPENIVAMYDEARAYGGGGR